MTETRQSYLKRVLPDFNEISLLVEEAMTKPNEIAPFHLRMAISRTQKLLEDLQRAARVDFSS